jgi:molybdenum cofactor cytidylyltransferase
MGRPKLSLPLGGRTVLEWTVAALKEGGVEHVLVVVGPHVAELADLAEQAGARVCRLAEPTPDMRATVEHGLTWLEQTFRPGEPDAWLLCPADHPTLHPGVVRQLTQARQEQPHRSIFVPTFEGRRGHPTLLGWRHVTGIRTHPAGLGLNTYVRQHGDEVLEVSVPNADALTDLDTPEDYERLQGRFAR